MQVVDFDAIVKNALYFRSILGGSRLCAVLKSDAYGHGIARTASALSGIADFVAVGSVEEALLVEPFCRNVLILLPIFDKGSLQTAVEHNFALTVDSFCAMEAIRESLLPSKKARIHLKINTGMNRLGFDLSELDSLLLRDFLRIEVEGVFSHFWSSDKKNCDTQTEKFLFAADKLCRYFRRPLIRHIANTCGALLSERYHMDMARIGLGLYGYGEKLSDAQFYADSLVPAKTVFAKVIAVRKVRSGEIVGYGGEYTFARDSNIAVVNAGYANGFSRALKNSVVKIGKNFFPVVGNICMSMLMADISNADVHVGDNVILLGNGVNNANSHVIVYELLCNLK